MDGLMHGAEAARKLGFKSCSSTEQRGIFERNRVKVVYETGSGRTKHLFVSTEDVIAALQRGVVKFTAKVRTPAPKPASTPDSVAVTELLVEEVVRLRDVMTEMVQLLRERQPKRGGE